MTALCAEILWTRNLSLLFGGTVYAFAVILAVFLVGLGVGSAAGAALGRRSDARRTLAWCQLALCGALAWGAYAIALALPYWPLDVTLPPTAAITLELDLLRAAIAILPAALLWGASFPLALAASMPARASGEHDSRHTVSALYAANTAGAIVGALATSFALIPWLGSARTQQLAIIVAAGAALLLLVTDRRGAALRRSIERKQPGHAVAAGGTYRAALEPRAAALGALSLAAALALAWLRPAAAARARRVRPLPADARPGRERRLCRRGRRRVDRRHARAERHRHVSQRR